jgi:transcription initiation factor IIE alpha subunit
MKVHIVSYTCEQCGATQTAEAGIHSDGMCPACGSPMRIEDLFSDRRIASLPVDQDRREHAA